MGVLLGQSGGFRRRGGITHFILPVLLSGAGLKTKTISITTHREISGTEVTMYLFYCMELILQNGRNLKGEEGDRNKINLGIGTC